MIAALLARIGWQGWLMLTAGVALVWLVWTVRDADREAGAAKERARIERANRTAEDAADDASRRVRACPPGAWNRETGRCVQ